MSPEGSKIIYSPKWVHEMKRTDPNLEELKKKWEEAYGTKVNITLVDGRIVVTPCSQ